MARSKSEINKSGALLADYVRIVADGGEPDGDWVGKFNDAIQAIEWWRGEHAKPLSRVAANLRYYASQEGTPIVAQRLKKFPTIAGSCSASRK